VWMELQAGHVRWGGTIGALTAKEMHSLTGLEDRSPKSNHYQGHVLSRL